MLYTEPYFELSTSILFLARFHFKEPMKIPKNTVFFPINDCILSFILIDETQFQLYYSNNQVVL
jgi:hypothetical protein